MKRRGFLAGMVGLIAAGVAAPALPLNVLTDAMQAGGAIGMDLGAGDSQTVIGTMYRGELGEVRGVQIILSDPKAIAMWSAALSAQLSKESFFWKKMKNSGLVVGNDLKSAPKGVDIHTSEQYIAFLESAPWA